MSAEASGDKRRFAPEARKHDKKAESKATQIDTYGEKRDKVTGRKRPKSLRESQQETDDGHLLEVESKKWVLEETKEYSSR